MTNILFDLDGTLSDPKIGITHSVRYALEKLGYDTPTNDDDLTWIIGPPLLTSFEQILDTKQEAQKALEYYRERFSTLGLYENEVYDGIPQILETLQKQGNKLYVATSKPRVYAEKIITHFGLSKYFIKVHGSELDGANADKTELLAYIIKTHGLDTKETIMIGDRKFDVIGAHNNHLASIGVLYGYGNKQELTDAGAQSLAETPTQITALVLPPDLISRK